MSFASQPLMSAFRSFINANLEMYIRECGHFIRPSFRILANIPLSEEDARDAKIALNMSWEGKSHFERWNESDANNRDVSYSYYSHYGNRRNFTHIGQLVFGFVQVPRNNKRWLLVTAGRITSLPNHATCDHVEEERFQGLVGRLIVEIEKGNTYSRYIFNLNKYYSEAKVIEILADDYQDISFTGLDNVHLSFHDLRLILNGTKYADYRNALSSVKGVYCLADTKTGKLYIGSAYGEKGIAQRWSDYIDTKTGGNKDLIELHKKEGEFYFENNFCFTLIEFFGMNTDTDRIVGRETYWKNAFATKDHGYNEN